MPTERMLGYFEERGIHSGVDMDSFGKAITSAGEFFPL